MTTTTNTRRADAYIVNQRRDAGSRPDAHPHNRMATFQARMWKGHTITIAYDDVDKVWDIWIDDRPVVGPDFPSAYCAFLAGEQIINEGLPDQPDSNRKDEWINRNGPSGR